ncbi:polysaccharide deacetylase family protein [Paenibacillus pasadenensis]|uniref:polysaccharide deacetylase family protein n=1 Tax=Paenibacillus pasadenensis TaxID=217090 RepID=UPI00203B17DE|nr:polysaccharide deacetylase family protein [Paenibacillus pasadenensis]MCM3747195.1 polysaccharide deacetylase family protein [Paenibacillus pasadenensis]
MSGFAGSPAKHGRSYYEARGDVVWEVPMDEKWIALTFDDGPSPKATPQILDLLKQYKAKATFFVIGYRLDKYPEIAAREAAEGHEVANHTDSHVYFRGGISEKTIAAEMDNVQKKIKAITKHSSPWFRPPGGYYNDTVIRIAKQHGYTIVLWSWHQDTKDWNSPGTGKIVNKVLKNARNGDIVLLHDYVSGSNQTIEALKIILPELKKRGYRMVTISELMAHQKQRSFRNSQ